MSFAELGIFACFYGRFISEVRMIHKAFRFSKQPINFNAHRNIKNIAAWNLLIFWIFLSGRSQGLCSSRFLLSAYLYKHRQWWFQKPVCRNSFQQTGILLTVLLGFIKYAIFQRFLWYHNYTMNPTCCQPNVRKEYAFFRT